MKKSISLLLALLLCVSLATAAFAAEKTLYLTARHEDYGYGAKETEDPTVAQMSVVCSDFDKTGEVVMNEYYTDSIYTAKAPVTLTTLVNAIVTVDTATFDPATSTYNVLEKEALYFDGDVTYYDDMGEEITVAAETFFAQGYQELYWYDQMKGSTLTLSAPGIYRISLVEGAEAGWCSFFVYVPEAEAQTGAATPETPVFDDVAADAWYAAPVGWALERGITDGTSDTTFSPDQTCTQAQILTFLWRAAGSQASTVANPFTNAEVTEEQYYYNALLWAYEKGIVTDADLDPNAPCTRADTVTYQWRNAESPVAAVAAAFDDVAADADYAAAVAWAVEQGITDGTSDTTFSPEQTCTRGHIVTFLYRDLAA